ncbi:MAG: hypothetical protein QNJ46_12525 [Leptolyngbyaceae cyanobacterium MO_188.B28]|nr:hypothetical protein [Leptolyngbyaceae cyanobacterium MO_188.B28]
MEITQAALNQLMGFMVGVALIYLAIAFALKLMRSRAETHSLSDYSQASPSPFQASLPLQDSLVNSMEPVLDWFEPADQSSAGQSDQVSRPYRAHRTEDPVAKNGSLSEGRDRAVSLPQPPIKPERVEFTFDTAQSSTAQLVDGFFQDDDDEMFGAADSSPSLQKRLSKPEALKQASAFKETHLGRNKRSKSKQSQPISKTTTEPAIPQSNGAQTNTWAKSEQPEPVGEELTEPAIAEFAELFGSQVEMSAAALSSQSKREAAGQPAAFGRESNQVTEPMPPEFEDIWNLVGKPEAALGLGTAGLVADLEALLRPEETAPLDQSIADIEELATLNLDDLFTSPAKVSPSAQYKPKPSQNLDGPTEEELEEIFGDEFQLTAYPNMNQH